MADVTCCCCASIPSNATGILESFGAFVKLLQPGLNCFCCCYEKVRVVHNNIQQMSNQTNTKTRNDVNITVVTAVQYTVKSENSRKAYYSLQAPVKQIEAYIDNCIRSHVPKMTLQEVFESKDSIGDAVKAELAQTMREYGYDIVNTLLTDIMLPANLIAAMNSKAENEQLKIAAVDKAEANKIAVITAAEANKIAVSAAADAEASKMRKLAEAQAEVDMLKGRGLAQQRMEMVRGLDQAVRAMSEDLKIEPAKTMDLVLAVQYYDTLKDIGHNAKSIMVPYSNNPQDWIRNSIIQGSEVRH